MEIDMKFNVQFLWLTNWNLRTYVFNRGIVKKLFGGD